MTSVLVIQHDSADGPGTLGEVLRARAIDLRVVQAYLGEPIPATLGAHAGLVVLGGGMNVDEADRHPHLLDELALLQDALAAEHPVLGICLGSQLLAKALGARVAPMNEPEVGWFEVELAEAAHFDPLWARVPKTFTAFHWHAQFFELPKGTQLLASSSACTNQAFAFGESAWGVQFHPEVNEEILVSMVQGGDEELRRAILAPMEGELPRYRSQMREVFDAWATQVLTR